MRNRETFLTHLEPGPALSQYYSVLFCFSLDTTSCGLGVTQGPNLLVTVVLKALQVGFSEADFQIKTNVSIMLFLKTVLKSSSEPS